MRAPRLESARDPPCWYFLIVGGSNGPPQPRYTGSRPEGVRSWIADCFSHRLSARPPRLGRRDRRSASPGARGDQYERPPGEPTRDGAAARRRQEVELPPYERYLAEFEEMLTAVREDKPLSVTPTEDLIVQETLVRASDMA